MLPVPRRWCLSACILLAIGTRAFAINGTPSWTFSQVAVAPGGNNFITSPTLAFDHYGTASVTWSRFDRFASSQNAVFEASLTPLGLWSTRQMASGFNVGYASAISYDRSERPHIAWMNSGGTIQSSFNFGTVQSPATSPTGQTVPATLALTHDLAGTLRGMYVGSTNGAVGAINWDGTNYSSSAMTTVPNISNVDHAALAVDHRGMRQMIFDARSQPSNTPAVVLASEPTNSSTWVSGVLATGDDIGGVDIQTNPANGHIGMAYAVRTGGSSTLYYTESNGNTLTTTAVTPIPAFEIGDVSLAFDAGDGLPAIAYEDTTGGRLLFSHRDSNDNWIANLLIDGTIATSAPDGHPMRPYLAFNDFGTGWPAVAYVDSDLSLRVAFDPPAPEPGTLAFFIAAAMFHRRNRVRA